jgi:hypothetical protein
VCVCQHVQLQSCLMRNLIGCCSNERAFEITLYRVCVSSPMSLHALVQPTPPPHTRLFILIHQVVQTQKHLTSVHLQGCDPVLPSALFSSPCMSRLPQVFRESCAVVHVYSKPVAILLNCLRYFSSLCTERLVQVFRGSLTCLLSKPDAILLYCLHCLLLSLHRAAGRNLQESVCSCACLWPTCQSGTC